MDHDEDGDPLFPEAVIYADKMPADVFIKGFMVRRLSNAALTRRGIPVPGMELLFDTTEGPLRMIVTRQEASQMAVGISEVSCDG